jgi:hypothetical protein
MKRMDSRQRARRICAVAIAALVASAESLAQTDPQARTGCARAEGGSQQEAIISEVSAFYRDLRAQQWAAVLDHFWPAKVTARWEPPLGDAAWQRSPNAPANEVSCACFIDDENGASASAEIHVVAAWARVLVSACRTQSATGNGKGEVHELWLLQIRGRWKIVHLASLAQDAV